MPPGIEQAYFFQVFNTISWQIVQGLPIFLFFKFLGASDTILGLAAALNPLMNMLQMPAASHVERIGYRAFVLRGWVSRTFFVGGIMLVPMLMYVLDRATCMVLTLFCLFIYSALRGISLCGFLPWMTQLVPEKVRGTYISRDQMFSSIACLVTLVGIAALFYPHPTQNSFAVAFLVSFLSGIMSLFFLRRMPDIPVPHQNEDREPTPWRSILFYPPFFKLMRYNLVMNSCFAASGIFWMSILRETYHWEESQILMLAASSSVVSIFIFWFFGEMIDRVGSLPILHFAASILICYFVLWFVVAGRIFPLTFVLISLLGITGGIGSPLFNLANTRLVMATVPEMGRSHFFAYFSVLNSLTLGVVPILWGIGLDALRHFHWRVGLLDIDHYAVLYFFLIITVIASFPLHRALKESRAMSTDEFFRELLVHSPSRVITRLLRARLY